jgi:spoIIIJ-associated protein
MSRRTEARGATLEEALASAVAELLDLAVDDVELRLRAVGAQDLEGRLQLDLEIETASDDDEELDETDEGTQDADADADAGASAPRPDQESDETDGAADDDAVATDEEAPEEREPIRPEDLDEEADVAADFLEGLLDAMDLPGDLRIRVHEDHAEVEVVDIGSGALIGRRGQTLEAIQELVRCALQREFQRRSRVKVDAEGYRSRRLEKLLEKAEEAIEDVLDGAEPERLEPMDVFERKAVHQLVATYDGVSSRSQGREPARRVIIERD